MDNSKEGIGEVLDAMEERWKQAMEEVKGEVKGGGMAARGRWRRELMDEMVGRVDQ